MTEGQLQRRITYWQRKLGHLGVGHWRVEEVLVQDETPAGPNAAMTVRSSGSYDSCQFRARRDWLENAGREEIDETIIHEWLHVCMRDLDHAIEAAEEWMPSHTWYSYDRAVDHEQEGVIDRLARQLYQFHSMNGA
jgi:hypothetical protein